MMSPAKGLGVMWDESKNGGGMQDKIFRKSHVTDVTRRTATLTRGPYPEGPEKFSHPKSRSKFSNLLTTRSCSIHIFLIRTEVNVPFIQEVSGVFTSLSLQPIN